ncbi:MAG: ferrous iron transport protein A [Spirochaetia bacterium]|nr:ferrous iron transport protein A [Spirochaetia bacterium]
MESIVRLSDLYRFDRFRVKAVMVGRETGRRLADLGFTEGMEGQMIRCGIMGGPMQVRLGAYDLLMRREEAAEVEVDLLEAGCARGRFGAGRSGRGRGMGMGGRGPGRGRRSA